jgi:hypothetical protein
LKKRIVRIVGLGGSVVLSLLIFGPASGQTVSTKAAPTAPGSAASERALLDHCVVCHNDKLKTANLSLQNLDLATAGDHAEVWERVVRKLRAGMMPPPGMPRPLLRSTNSCAIGSRPKWIARRLPIRTPARLCCTA